MATQYDNAIQQLYVAYFNRPADAGGIAHWANFMTNGGTAAQISAAFADTMEYQTAYNQLTSAGVVTQVYQNLFGRTPDSSGLAFWVKALNDGNMTVDNMVTTIAAGAQGSDKVAFDSKVKVATAFTNALDTDAEKAGYSGDLANAAAKKLLANIKTDAQANAAIVPATLNASIDGVIKASVPFTLETGLERLDAAKKAVADFLADAEIDLDDDGEADENVDEGDIGQNLINADSAVSTLINDSAYDSTDSATVKAAIIADKLAKAAADLETKQGTLTTEFGKLTSAQASAVATATATAEAAETAVDANTEAQAALFGATSVLEDRNTGANKVVTVNDNGTVRVTTTTFVPAPDPADPAIPVPKHVELVVMKDGVLALGAELKATDYPGVANYIAAANAAAAADRAATDAVDTALLAQARVELSDLGTDATSTGALTTLANAFGNTGPVTPATAGKPTADEVAAQLNGLKLLAVDAREKANAAPGDNALDLAADTAEGRVETFRTAVDTYNEANATVAVTRVTNAEAAVETAQEYHTDLEEAVANLTEAKALADQLESLEKAVETATADFKANKFAEPKDVSSLSNFGTAGNDIFVVNPKVLAANITSFGLQGNDVLYVGAGYTLNEGKLTDGDNSALEVFFTQQGSSTVVTIETVEFGSSSSAGAGSKVTITLTGVDADDLTFENGIISL